MFSYRKAYSTSIRSSSLASFQISHAEMKLLSGQAATGISF